MQKLGQAFDNLDITRDEPLRVGELKQMDNALYDILRSNERIPSAKIPHINQNYDQL